MAEEEKVTAVAEEATSMADYEKELEASFKKLEEGDMITGTVIAVDEEEITLDLRYYTEGIIKVSDYSREPYKNYLLKYLYGMRYIVVC